MIPDEIFMKFMQWYNQLPLNENFSSHDYPYTLDRHDKQRIMIKLKNNEYIERVGYSDKKVHYYRFKKLKNYENYNNKEGFRPH